MIIPRLTLDLTTLVSILEEVVFNEGLVLLGLVEDEFEGSNNSFRRSSNLLLVIGLSSRPWLAKDKVPDSSETTTQIHLSNRSVIPRAAKCLVPYLLIPCLERG